MPQYATAGSNSQVLNTVPPTVLQPGDEKYLIGTSFAAGSSPTPGVSQKPNDSNVVAEAKLVGYSSIAVQLGPRPGGGSPPGLSVYITASADPGTTEIDVQEADVDADGAYSLAVSTNKITTFTKVGLVWVAQLDISTIVGRFIRLNQVAVANACNLTAKVVYS